MAYSIGSSCLKSNCCKLLNNIFVRNLSIKYSGFKESSVSTAVSSNSSDQDILLKSIKCSKETSDVLHYIGKHYSIMNRTHILQAFKIIFNNQKCDGMTMSNGEVTKSGEFKALCNALKPHVRSLELNDTIDIIKIISYLGIPPTSKLMSIMLNLIANQVNQLSLQQIVFLDFLMKDFKPSPIVEALRIALPVVFQANLNVKLDSNNVFQACDLLSYSTRKRMPVETIDPLIDVIMRLRNDLDLNSAMSVVRSLCEFNSADESHRPLLHHSLDIVTDNIKQCTFSELDVLLSKCVLKYSRDNYFFYHEEFVKSVSNFVISNDCSFEEGIWTLRKLNKLGHVEISLLDFLAYKAEPALSNMTGSKSSFIFSLVKGLALADHRPFNWASLEPILIKHTEYLFQENKDVPWVSYMRDLCTLGTWSLSIIEKVFQPGYIDKFLGPRSTVLDHLQMLSLYQEVTTLCPEEYKPSPPQKTLEIAMEINGKNLTHFPLLTALQKGLGGSSYIVSGVYTKLGHFLHHVVALRKGGFPVPLNLNKTDSRTYVEDLHISDEHTTIAVLCIPSSFYCANIDILRGPMKQNLNSISALGITVVPISSSRWEDLLEHEKIPYLMREINDKCNFSQSETVIS